METWIGPILGIGGRHAIDTAPGSMLSNRENFGTPPDNNIDKSRRALRRMAEKAEEVQETKRARMEAKKMKDRATMDKISGEKLDVDQRLECFMGLLEFLTAEDTNGMKKDPDQSWEMFSSQLYLRPFLKTGVPLLLSMIPSYLFTSAFRF